MKSPTREQRYQKVDFLNLGTKTVQSQIIENPSPQYHRESSTQFYQNFIKNVQDKERNSGGSIHKLPSKSLVYTQDLGQVSKTDFRNNDEIKNYLQRLDTLIQSNSNQKKNKDNNSMNTPLKYERSSIDIRNEEDNNASLGKSRYLEENDGLKYLEKKYLTNEIRHKLNHSTTLIKSNDHWMHDDHQYQLGEILCMNCQEFINPNEINAHSKICDKEMNSVKLGLLNDKIENLKLLLMINYKNSTPDNSEEFIEFENFIHIGTVIIDEISLNNAKIPKLKENFEDLKELYYSMNRLRTKRMVAIKSLVQRMFQIIQLKINMIESPIKKEALVYPVSQNNNMPINEHRKSENYNVSPEKERDQKQRLPVPQKKLLMDYFDEKNK